MCNVRSKERMTMAGGLSNLTPPILLIPDCTEHPHPLSNRKNTILMKLFLDQGHLLCTGHAHTHKRSLNTILLNPFLLQNHHTFHTLRLMDHPIHCLDNRIR
uniref:Uncharacterized protein n=1 Tax=Arundo donax TaxID=35708 RepID=A0A0A9CHU0_ARUDO